MKHEDHVNLIRSAVPESAGCWADLGSGEGAFTLALYELVGPNGEIYSVDKDKNKLEVQRKLFRDRFPRSNVHYLNDDFMNSLELPPLDGVLMANSLHFVREKEKLLGRVVPQLRMGGRFILVEYNVDSGNAWVPYPISFEGFRSLATGCALSSPVLTGKYPSRFLREIYSAVAVRLITPS